MSDREYTPWPTNGPFMRKRETDGSAEFRRLKSGPDTAVDLDKLSADERERVEVIGDIDTFRQRYGRSTDRYIPVYYLSDHEDEAVELFVELNKSKISELDVDRENVLKENLRPRIYREVLIEAEQVRVKRYRLVVREAQGDGNLWLIERERYEERPSLDHQPGPAVTLVPLSKSLRAIYYQFGETITTEDIRETQIKGSRANVLYYYVCEDEFDCTHEITDDREAIVRKL